MDGRTARIIMRNESLRILRAALRLQNEKQNPEYDCDRSKIVQMQSVVNQCAYGTVIVFLKIFMMVLGDRQKACRDKHDDEFAYV